MERCRPILTVTAETIARRPVFVADAAGVAAGFYALAPRDRELELDLLFVEPAWLRRGIGSLLLAHALERARALGHQALLVESDPGAEPFYLGAGATRIGAVASNIRAGRMLPLLRFELGAGVRRERARGVRRS